MRLISTTVWDEYFFTKFFTFRNEIHKDIITSFPEELEDYTKFFGPGSPFENDYSWEAFMVESEDRILAKAILTYRKGSDSGNLGFLDWVNDSAPAQLLVEAVKATAKRHGLKRLKTPIDLNFYLKYRIRLPGGQKPFWGEPVYPDYYHELFQTTGFNEIARWDSYRLGKIQGIIDYFLKRLKLAKKPTGSHSKTRDKKLRTKVRCIRMNDWENELKIIHHLFSTAYQNMPEWEPITFDQFKLIYDDFKYIVNPWFAYIVELRGIPVGFSINFADPLPVLARVKGKKLNTFQKAKLLASLRTNRSTFLIAHVGKIPGPDGEEIKGVQIQVSRRIQFFGALMKKVLVTFQVKDSPSRRSFDQKYQTSYAEYVLYGLELE